MANEQNLKPIKKGQLSKEELKRRQSNGGKKSVEARREKKLFKEALLVALEAKDENGEYGLTKVVMGIFKEAVKGNPKAFEVIRDTIGEKPVEEIMQTGAMQIVVNKKED